MSLILNLNTKTMINYFGTFSNMWFALCLRHVCFLINSRHICLIIDFDNTKNVLFTLCPYDVRSLEGMKHKYILVEIMHI